MKQYLNASIFGAAIVIASFFMANAYVNRNSSEGEIQVTGLGKADFASDLIVWEANFMSESKELSTAYKSLEEYKAIINKYLLDKGVKAEEIVFSAVKTRELKKSNYSSEGEYIGQEFTGYQLRQTVQIESKEVSKIETISREVTELLNQGLQLYSDPPRYYYTKLADLKIEMISKATQDARTRAEHISKYSGGELGKLQSAKMGVFQITGQNSKEEYSWGGTFNTTSKEKTASITMKLIYTIK